ncbi:MAG: hypothetical protein GF364_00135 [Candidatus Lokiarchaeota archaeon]|nr:hypothetical protein [Candidatus Lokiarchaeota archaeon]
METQIDKAVSIDFEVKKLSSEDLTNENYKSLKFSLEFSGITILYERKVLSNKAPVIPDIQYLFGFEPVDGLCIFAKNKVHKEVLCDGKLFQVLRNSNSFVHSLQYLLVESDEFNVWSYLPLIAELKDDSNTASTLELRTKLFMD